MQSYTCQWCKDQFLAEKDAKTCSDSCRQNLHRYGCGCGGVFMPHTQRKIGKKVYLIRKCSECPKLMGGPKEYV